MNGISTNTHVQIYDGFIAIFHVYHAEYATRAAYTSYGYEVWEIGGKLLVQHSGFATPESAYDSMTATVDSRDFF